MSADVVRRRSESARPRIERSRTADQADYSATTLDAKVVILGRQGVGKTSLVRRYTSNTYHPPSTQSTTGAFFVTKKCTVDGVGVRLQIWDTAGQERFRSMAPMYIRGANAAIVVYDLTSEQSFQDVRMWIDELKKSTPPELLVYVVGSKYDLASAHRAVTRDFVRLSLNRWYPPPPPPQSQPDSQSPTPSLFSPRRTRLISLPSALPLSRSTPALTATSASNTSASSASDRDRPRLNSSPSAPAPARRPRLVSSPSSPTPGLRAQFGGHANGHGHGRPWSWGSSPDEKDEYLAQALPPSASSSSSADDDDDELDADVLLPPSPVSLQANGNWALFEVSAKDDIGIQALFAQLIRALLCRRRAIAHERELRTRGSVMLGEYRPNAGGKGGEAQGRWGVGCCGV